MAKQRQFDEAEVLQKMAEHFWQHGYGATRMDQLSELTGLTKTSIYNAFGNKEAVFIRVLDFYAQRGLSQQISILDTTKPMSVALQNLFDRAFLNPDNTKLSYGCLITNTIVELAANDAALHERATRGFKQVRQTMHTFFAHYVDNDLVIAGFDADHIVDTFMSFLLGLRVQSRTINPDITLQRSIETFLRLMQTIEKPAA